MGKKSSKKDTRRRTVEPSGYYAYIRSDAWQAVRRRYWTSNRPKDCYVCGNDDGPKDLHHVTYNHLGNEDLSDLVPLCRACHEAVHALFDSKRRMSLRRVTDRLRKKHYPQPGRGKPAAAPKPKPVTAPKPKPDAHPVPVPATVYPQVTCPFCDGFHSSSDRVLETVAAFKGHLRKVHPGQVSRNR